MSEALDIAANDAPDFDVDEVRREFPILAREVYGKPLVYLDNAASAQKPLAVREAMDALMAEDYANVHRGLHYLSNTSTQAYEAARGKVARFLNAAREEEVIFTSGSTDAINLVANAWGRDNIGEGDEIVLSLLEHHSNIVPWHFLREEKGAVIKWAPVLDDGSLDMDALEKLIGPKTKLVAITHMSNALGTTVDVEKVTGWAHAHGAKILVDGSQGAVHLKPDVQAIGCDFYAFTGHKLYGPTGIGVLWGRHALLETMRPYRGGGEMIRDVTTEGVTYAEPPMRFEAGTPAIVQAVGLGAAIDFVEGLGREAIMAHEAGLLGYAMDQIRELNFVKVIGTAPDKGAILSFEMEGAHAHDVSTIIDRSGVAVRAGHHCAQPLMDRFGVTSTCRASFGLYNTRAEVDALVTALKKAREFLA